MYYCLKTKRRYLIIGGVYNNEFHNIYLYRLYLDYSIYLIIPSGLHLVMNRIIYKTYAETHRECWVYEL